MTLFLTISLYAFILFIIVYGFFISYEDLKSKEIHANPLLIVSLINFPCMVFAQQCSLGDGIKMIVISVVLLTVLSISHLWGMGDTKMCFAAFTLIVWMFKPAHVFAFILLIAIYLFILSVLGLSTALIKQDKKPPMAQCFLITNILSVIAYVTMYTRGVNII